MSEKKYEESLNYTNLLMLQLNDIRIAMQSGKTGSIELENFYMLLTASLKETIQDNIDKIEKEYADIESEKLKQWTVLSGHPSNNKFIVEVTASRQAELQRLRILANQRIVQEIIHALYDAGMLLTNNTNLPASVV